jgi:hypothetical protein
MSLVLPSLAPWRYPIAYPTTQPATMQPAKMRQPERIPARTPARGPPIAAKSSDRRPKPDGRQPYIDRRHWGTVCICASIVPPRGRMHEECLYNCNGSIDPLRRDKLWRSPASRHARDFRLAEHFGFNRRPACFPWPRVIKRSGSSRDRFAPVASVRSRIGSCRRRQRHPAWPPTRH